MSENFSTPKIAICAIGSELTNGRFVDTNSAWLASELRALGLAPSLHITLPDEERELHGQLAGLWEAGYSLVITGGLGPTVDDLTRPACAKLLGCELRGHPEALDLLREFRRKAGRDDPDMSESQLQVPVLAEPILNHHGTATGIQYWEDARFILAFPGVPRELKGMWSDSVLARLKQRYSEGSEFSRELLSFGIFERSMNDLLIKQLDHGIAGIDASILINDIVVRVAWSTRDAGLRGEVERLEAEAIALIGDRLIHRTQSDGDPSMLTQQGADAIAAIVVALLEEREERVAFAESCTGGMASELITSVPGSSSVLDGSVVSYANRIKQDWLGVSAEILEEHGAVSEAVVLAMASGVRAMTGADWGVSFSGVAGPGGGSDEKPVGSVWIGVDSPFGKGAWLFHSAGDRHMVRWRAARSGINLIRLAIQHEALPPADYTLVL